MTQVFELSPSSAGELFRRLLSDVCKDAKCNVSVFRESFESAIIHSATGLPKCAIRAMIRPLHKDKITLNRAKKGLNVVGWFPVNDINVPVVSDANIVFDGTKNIASDFDSNFIKSREIMMFVNSLDNLSMSDEEKLITLAYYAELHNKCFYETKGVKTSSLDSTLDLINDDYVRDIIRESVPVSRSGKAFASFSECTPFRIIIRVCDVDIMTFEYQKVGQNLFHLVHSFGDKSYRWCYPMTTKVVRSLARSQIPPGLDVFAILASKFIGDFGQIAYAKCFGIPLLTQDNFMIYNAIRWEVSVGRIVEDRVDVLADFGAVWRRPVSLRETGFDRSGRVIVYKTPQPVYLSELFGF